MSWETFWVPNLLQATLFAGISAIVGAAVGLIARRYFRRWAAQMFGEQQRTTNAAEAAASEARDNSRQVGETVEWLAAQLAARDVVIHERDLVIDDRDAVIDELRDRIDGLLGTRARQLAASRPDTASSSPLTVSNEDDPATVTGKHRLHTQRIQTNELGARE